MLDERLAERKRKENVKWQWRIRERKPYHTTMSNGTRLIGEQLEQDERCGRSVKKRLNGKICRINGHDDAERVRANNFCNKSGLT